VPGAFGAGVKAGAGVTMTPAVVAESEIVHGMLTVRRCAASASVKTNAPDAGQLRVVNVVSPGAKCS
jgi:hypothetical protein